MTEERSDTLEIRDIPDEGAYVAFIDGERAGKAQYVIRDDRRVFTHTEVDDAYKGAGVGTRLVRDALDDARARGVAVVPLCPFFRAFVRRHPEYEDLVDQEMTDRYIAKHG